MTPSIMGQIPLIKVIASLLPDLTSDGTGRTGGGKSRCGEANSTDPEMRKKKWR